MCVRHVRSFSYFIVASVVIPEVGYTLTMFFAAVVMTSVLCHSAVFMRGDWNRLFRLKLTGKTYPSLSAFGACSAHILEI